jgi:hypothetical protein
MTVRPVVVVFIGFVYLSVRRLPVAVAWVLGVMYLGVVAGMLLYVARFYADDAAMFGVWARTLINRVEQPR